MSAASGAAIGALGGGSAAGAFGREIALTNNIRIAPRGNSDGHALGRFPHYHRRVIGSDGQTVPGGGIGRHRPWETKSTDTSFWDRF